MNRRSEDSGYPYEGMESGERLLRRREVEKITGLSRSSIYRLMPLGLFPRPVQVGPKAVRWRLSDIRAWLASRPIVGDDLGQADAA